jgi:hypothetical protein
LFAGASERAQEDRPVDLTAVGKISLVIVFAAGCGSVYVKPLDASVDAPDADQTAMATVVTAFTPGTAAPMIDVVSLRPNNTVADMTQTDATGHASIQIYPGGTVTAIFKHTVGNDMGADLATITDVQANDTLTFTPPNAFNSGGGNTVVGQMTANWPSLGAPPAIGWYYVWTPCGQWYAPYTVSSVTFTEYDYCHKSPMQMGYVAYNTSGVIVSYGFQTSVAFTSGGSTLLPAWSPPKAITLTAPAFAMDISTVYTYTLQVLNGRTGFEQFNGDFMPSMAYAPPTYPMPDGARVVGFADFVRKGSSTSQSVYDAISGTSWAIAQPTELPWVPASAFSLPDHKIAWFADGTTPYDGIAAIVGWQRQTMAGPPPVFNTYTWTFAIKPGESELTYPVLPSPFDMVAPTLDDQPTLENLWLVDYPGVSDWNGFRALPSQQFACPYCQVFNGTYPHVQTSP